MTGWILIAEVWHYARGDRTLCGQSVTSAAIVVDVMTRGLPNCKACETKRLSEVSSYVEIEGR
jgi:hypothetical protein